MSKIFLNEDNAQKLSIWAVTDEGANVISALSQLKEDGTISGYNS